MKEGAGIKYELGKAKVIDENRTEQNTCMFEERNENSQFKKRKERKESVPAILRPPHHNHTNSKRVIIAKQFCTTHTWIQHSVPREHTHTSIYPGILK